MTIRGFTRFALVTESGIFYQAAYYSCSQAIRHQWFAKVLVTGVWAIPVCYCTVDKTKIYLLKGEDVVACFKLEQLKGFTVANMCSLKDGGIVHGKEKPRGDLKENPKMDQRR